MNKWASINWYYKSIYSNNFIPIEEYYNKKTMPKWKKAKSKKKRYNKKKDSIKNYRVYINSKERKEKRIKFFIKYKFKCQLCKKEFLSKNLNLHHHTYERVWKERNSDFAIVCISCHQKIHFKNWKKIRLNEKDLRERFKELVF